MNNKVWSRSWEKFSVSLSPYVSWGTDLWLCVMKPSPLLSSPHWLSLLWRERHPAEMWCVWIWYPFDKPLPLCACVCAYWPTSSVFGCLSNPVRAVPGPAVIYSKWWLRVWCVVVCVYERESVCTCERQIALGRSFIFNKVLCKCRSCTLSLESEDLVCYVLRLQRQNAFACFLFSPHKTWHSGDPSVCCSPLSSNS